MDPRPRFQVRHPMEPIFPSDLPPHLVPRPSLLIPSRHRRPRLHADRHRAAHWRHLLKDSRRLFPSISHGHEVPNRLRGAHLSSLRPGRAS